MKLTYTFSGSTSSQEESSNDDTTRAIVTTATTAIRSPTIKSLPCELLLRILLLLPVRARGLAERVCKKWREELVSHGWHDIHHYDDTEEVRNRRLPKWVSSYYCFTLRNRQLLQQRIGTHLRSASLEIGPQGTALGALEACPKLVHLRLRSSRTTCWHRTSTSLYELPELNFIQQSYACNLKTLSLAIEIEARQAFEQLLRALSSLEYLRLELSQISQFPAFPEELTAKFTKLTLCSLTENAFLSNNQLAWLTSPSLCSLTLDCNLSTGVLPIRLEQLPLLEHLSIRVNSSNIDSLANMLPNAMRNLKALEVAIGPPVSDGNFSAHIRRLTSSVVANLPQLQHLGIDITKAICQMGSDNWCEAFATARMEGLASLELRCCSDNSSIHPGMDTYMGGLKWDWLNEIFTLQHLAIVGWIPRLSTLCAIIKSCKNLHYMDLGKFEPSIDDSAALASAKNVTDNKETQREVDAGNNENEGPLLILRANALQIRLGGPALPLPLSGKSFGCARLRFVQAELPSHVLHHHAYGFLSEGKPLWEDKKKDG